MREGAGLESVKDGDRKQGGFKCGTTVPGHRRTKWLGGDIEKPGDVKTTENDRIQSTVSKRYYS